MYSGSRCLQARAQLLRLHLAPRRGTTYATSRLSSPRRPPAPPPPPPAPPACSASTASISPSSIRNPRIFTWWSMPPQVLERRRPPSAPHQVARPVQPRPRRPADTDPARTAPPSAPAAPGSPAPAPPPPTYSSPGTPIGTGSRCPSSTYTRRSGIGTPITLPAPPSRSAAASRPVRHVHRRLGDPVHVHQLAAARRRAARTTAAGSRAPAPRRRRSRTAAPVATGRPRPRPPRISCRNADGVWFSTVTRSRTSSSWNASGDAAHPVRHDHQAPAVAAAPPTSPTPRSRTRTSGTASTRPRSPNANHPSVAVEQPHHVAVRDQHALGLAPSSPTCRSRRPDCPPATTASRDRSRWIRPAALPLVLQTQHHARSSRGTPLPHAAPASAPPARARPSTMNAQRLGRIRRVQRQVRPPRLEHPQIATTNSTDRSRHSPTTLSGPTPRARSSRASRIGPRVQLPVRHHLALSAHRHRPRRPPHLPLE